MGAHSKNKNMESWAASLMFSVVSIAGLQTLEFEGWWWSDGSDSFEDLRETCSHIPAQISYQNGFVVPSYGSQNQNHNRQSTYDCFSASVLRSGVNNRTSLFLCWNGVSWKGATSDNRWRATSKDRQTQPAAFSAACEELFEGRGGTISTKHSYSDWMRYM